MVVQLSREQRVRLGQKCKQLIDKAWGLLLAGAVILLSDVKAWWASSKVSCCLSPQPCAGAAGEVGAVRRASDFWRESAVDR